jgi:hypothetical protein
MGLKAAKISNEKASEANRSFISKNKQSKPLFFQPKLTIGPTDDIYEREADAVADRVMRMSDHEQIQTKISPLNIQRKCAACEEEHLQRKEDRIEDEQLEAPSIVSDALDSGGNPLEDNTRTFMEGRFGYDFSSVRIHTGTVAAKSAQSINALAYTSGNNIVFNKDQYNPQSNGGKKLLAHELTHVVQQKNKRKVIQRACSPQHLTEYDTIAAEIPQLPLFQNVPVHPDAIYTPRETRQVANDIIAQARSHDECLYYIRNLHLLFSTSESAPVDVAAIWGPRLAAAAQDEQTRLQNQSQEARDFEENLSAASQLSPVPGHRSKTYEIDRTDLNNIVVKIKINLTGEPQLVSQAQSLEDGIEKKASVLGYTIDIDFVTTTGSDVFEATVNTAKWPTSGNFSGDIDVMAHEVHHLLNLPDRYNYIDAHSGNPQMYVANRIHWFWEEFNRPSDPNRYISFMGEGSLVTDTDICTVSQATDVAACVSQRQSLRSGALSTKLRANRKTQRLIEVLAGFIPPSLLDPRADATTMPAAQQMIRRTAALIFGHAVDDATIDASLYRMKMNLLGGQITMENTTAPECGNESISIRNTPPTFIVCPSFSSLSEDDQQKEFLRLSYRIYQEFSATGAISRSVGNPMDPAEAQKWADFVMMAYARI